MIAHPEVKNWNGHSTDEERGNFASHQRDGEALEYGVGQNDRSANNDGERGEQHGAEPYRSGVDNRLFQGHSL